MNEKDITAANFWIRRWKMVGGGFKPQIMLEGIGIEIVRQPDADPKLEAIYAKTAAVLEQELADNHAKHKTVCALVVRKLRGEDEPKPASLRIVDNEPPDPPAVA